MLLDANLLLFAQDSASPFHATARPWLQEVLNGPRRVGLPWPSLLAFARIRTQPRLYRHPLTALEAWQQIEDWLAAPAAWVPQAGERHAEILGDLVRRYHLAGKSLPDGHLAALALEHGVAVASADTDFARFAGLDWINPLA